MNEEDDESKRGGVVRMVFVDDAPVYWLWFRLRS